MKYLRKKFSLPAGSSKISQEDWDRIFGKKEAKKKKKSEKGSHRER